MDVGLTSVSASTLGNHTAGIRFLFEVTFGKDWHPVSPLRQRMLEDMDLPYAESESGALAICSAHPPVTCQIQPTCMVGKGAAEGQVVAH
jgi:hypothetical protein